ncbi:MAG: hypothetical protein KF911_01945 [Pseudomonadales bacterium]|nr:hypothetical protein [Pseudomonadales bacterium]
MGRVLIVESPERNAVPFPGRLGIVAGDALSRPIVTTTDSPIHLWAHELAEGASISLVESAVDRLLYVWRGAARAGQETLGEQGLVIVERGAVLDVAAQAPAVILHFFRAGDRPDVAARAGGHVHVITHGNAPKGTDDQGVIHTLFAGSDYPTCELWFHRTDLPAGFEVPRHYHTEDEIIFVVSGSMLLGRRQLTPGAALAIDEGTIYRFRAGPDGLGFLNFRTSNPWAVLADQNMVAIDEGQYLRDLIRTNPASAH